MLETLQTGVHWKPLSSEERELVVQELDAILDNHHFRGSKRYPALLRHVVYATLDGHIGDLKERTLGIEVFGRAPDYDTSADPVVRFSASEVRKRLAQYYHEQADRTRLQIELPLGSYVPQFLLRIADPPTVPGVITTNATSPNVTSPGRRRARRMRWLILSPIAALLVAGAIYTAYSSRTVSQPAAVQPDALWEPLLKMPGQVIVVVGTSHPNKVPMASEQTTFNDFMTGPYHHVSVASAVALAHLAAILRLHGNLYQVKEDNETSVADLRSRPAILIGAMNNVWTLRLMSSMRFHFVREGKLAEIRDTQNPSNTAWTVDFAQAYNSVHTDYGIVARFRDPVTEGPVIVVAGLGTYGTQAASEFATLPLYLEQIRMTAPAGWQNQNVEFVIKTDVIGGKAGPPELIATTVW
jgi:hypothetical protein